MINHQLCPVIRFLEYITRGLQINLIIGIDFTASNLTPNDPKSLHYGGSNMPSQYERAIKSCGTILAYYDHDQNFAVYGFGGRPPGENMVNHCFNLNLQNSPYINTIDNVVDEYKNNVFKILFDGPTFFAPLITNAVNLIKIEMSNEPKYHILMILTDGRINDEQDTIDVLVNCDVLPLSVIIIGIGNANFQNMYILDSEDGTMLTNSYGVQTKRDLVQFVEFNKFGGNSQALSQQVLKKIPSDVEAYYKLTTSFKI